MRPTPDQQPAKRALWALGILAAAAFAVAPASALADGGVDYLDPCGGLKNPCGPDDDIVIEDNDRSLCEGGYEMPGDPGYCDRMYGTGSQDPEQESAPAEPAPDPEYVAPEPDAEHLGGCVYWHPDAGVVTCHGITKAAQ